MKRSYEAIIDNHFANYEQMVFLSGPRQVGKTTIAKQIATTKQYFKYLNWDIATQREQILKDSKKITSELYLDTKLAQKPLIIFDEIHKYKNWKNLLKGFIDEYKGILDILVTGSAKLNLLRRSKESLMGRYFLYRIHPLSIGELCNHALPDKIITTPKHLENDVFSALFNFGGFPEPFIKQSLAFSVRWQKLRREQMLREDIASLTHIHELSQLEVLALILREQVGQLTNFSQLGKKIQVPDNTIRRWMKVLEEFYYCFTIKPWKKNITRSLLKMPKIYLWDWSLVENKGAKIENFVASHLYKAVNFWTDLGLGEFELFFVRDKEENEVDFLVTKNDSPWLLIETKSSLKEPLNSNLLRFQKQLNAQIALQLAFDLPFADYDCFQIKTPKIVSLKTFLSQLP
jgi:uncharacterized protein